MSAKREGPAPKTRGGSTIPYNASTSISRSVTKMTNNVLRSLWGPPTRRPANVNSNTLKNISLPNNRSKANFIIKWGPPASGKGSDLVKNIIARMGHPLSSYLQFGIDDAIEPTNYFINESSRVASNYFGPIKGNENAMMEKLNKITEKNAGVFGGVYLNVRRAKNKNDYMLGNKLDKLLKAAIADRRNITFETTGGSENISAPPPWPSWIWASNPSFFENYNLIVIFPMVSFTETWRRYRKRAIDMLKNGRGFRFASTKRQLYNSYWTAYINFRRNIVNTNKMAKVSKIIVVPYRKEAIEWNPHRVTADGARRSRKRQEIINLCDKYATQLITNPNIN
jgi:hypothetical protein